MSHFQEKPAFKRDGNFMQKVSIMGMGLPDFISLFFLNDGFPLQLCLQIRTEFVPTSSI